MNVDHTHSRGDMRRRGWNEVRFSTKKGARTLLGDLGWMVDLRAMQLSGCLATLSKFCFNGEEGFSL